MGFLKSLMQDLQNKGEQMVVDNINSRLPEEHKLAATNNNSNTNYKMIETNNNYNNNNNNNNNMYASSERGFFGSSKKNNNSNQQQLSLQNIPTRWEKAVVSLNRIVSQVSKFDPDGVDVICFGGDNTQPDIYRNIKDVKSIESAISSKQPYGACNMANAIDCAIQQANNRGFHKRPCSILVLTAGCPNDCNQVDTIIRNTTSEMCKIIDDKKGEYKKIKESPISITFVQIGDDEQATQYLKHLDNDLIKQSSRTGQSVDIVDTIKDEDIKKAMKEFQKTGGKEGAMIGAFTGAALGVGGVYLYNQRISKQRAAHGGWNGKWKVSYCDRSDTHKLVVEDDRDGCLTISGYPKGVTTSGNYITDESTGGLYIQFIEPNTTEAVSGIIEDEHTIVWSDGCRWEEIPPKGVHWTTYAGAAVVGAAAGGATGYLLQKNFFNKVSKHEQCDYVVILDRSAMMAVPDSGK